MSAGGRDTSVVTLNGKTYPVVQRQGGNSPIQGTPQIPFGQVTTVGDTVELSDQRTSSVIIDDQTLGMGRDRYVLAEGTTDFKESDCDTRFAGAIVLRPEVTQLGGIPGGFPGQRVMYLGYAGASLITHSLSTRAYTWDGAVWSQVNTSIASQIMRGLGGVFISHATNLIRSTNGTAWSSLATTGLPAGASLFGVAKHDAKLYTLAVDAAGTTVTMCFSANPMAAAAAVTWTTGGSFSIEAGVERPVQLIEWRDRGGRRALYCITSRRILGYDDDNKIWQEFHDFSDINTDGTPDYVHALVWPRTDDLWLCPGGGADYLLQFTGTAINVSSPNAGGGLSAARQGSITTLACDRHQIFAWQTQTTISSAGKGQALALNERGGWHTLYRNTATIVGGGAASGRVWTVDNGGSVYEQRVPDTAGKPQFATGRRYDTTIAQTHTYGLTGLGTDLLDKLLLGFTLNLRTSTGRPGLDANTSAYCEYSLDGGTTWTLVTQARVGGANVTLAGGLITSATITNYPVRLVVNSGSGVACKDLMWRVTLASTDPTKTPVLRSSAPRFIRRPEIRFNYEFVIDLSDAAWGGNALPQRGGRSAAQARAELLALVKQAPLVSFGYGYGPAATTIGYGELALAPNEDPFSGKGLLRCIVRDLTSADSG